MSELNVIAIDGPVASGKTVVGRLLSKSLRYSFLDTGSMYRAITWVALERGLDMASESLLGNLAHEVHIQVNDAGHGGVTVDGQDITQYLNLSNVEKHVSYVAQILEVRRALVEQQRIIGSNGEIVMSGRDIGTVVLPDAKLKIFLNAPATERARRRHNEALQRGENVSYQNVLREIIGRDKVDTTRTHSPLRAASDALIVETHGLDVNQVINAILGHLKEN